MRIDELKENELTMLKQHYLTTTHRNISWQELADADDLVSMEELKNFYGGIEFTEEDFICESNE
jgi:hypothetical protein